MHEVRLAQRADAAPLAGMLARAFASDPVSSYLFPDPHARSGALARFFTVQLRRNYLLRGEVWVEGSLRGAALWMPPTPLRPATLGEVAVHLGLLAVFREHFGTARRLARLLAERHPRTVHYYLGTLGTEPACQRQGIASALLAPVLARCDAEGVPAYLESSRVENVPFYEARGFAVVETVDVPSGPRLWLMWRPPSISGRGSAGDAGRSAGGG